MDFIAEAEAAGMGEGALALMQGISLGLSFCAAFGLDKAESIDRTTAAFVETHGENVPPILIALTVAAVADAMEREAVAALAAQN